MSAEDVIEVAFKELLKEIPYTKLTVTEICQAANVSRRAFYDNFQDKEDIVERLFDKHVMEPMRAFHRVLSFEESLMIKDSNVLRMYESIYRESEYYSNLIRPIRGHDDTFLRVATWAIYRFNMEHIPRLRKPSTEWKLDYTAYFFASSQAMLIQKWVSDGFKVSPCQLTELYQAITLPFWERVIDNRDTIQVPKHLKS